MALLGFVEIALANGNQDLAADRLLDGLDRLGPAELYYQVIRDDLQLVFKLLESPCFGISEREAFVFCSNALLELKVKNVDLSEEMQMRVLVKCSAYGLRNLSGPPTEVKPKDYWKVSIDLVDGWVKELRSRKQWFDFLDVEDEVVFRMRMIHNHLFFIKDHPLLKNLPLKEMIFCLAVYVDCVCRIPVCEDAHNAYKIYVNNRKLIQFLMAIASRLRMIKDNNIENPKQLKRSSVLKKLRKMYRKLKQMHSVFKVSSCDKIGKDTNNSEKRCNAFITVAAFKRFQQIFGEAIKNTQDTPNLSAKISNVVPDLLSDNVTLSSKYRNFSSHGFHLWELFVRDTDEVFYYDRLDEYTYMTTASFYLLAAYVLYDCTRYLYGSLRRCRTTGEVQAMIRYIGHNVVRFSHEELFRQINRYFTMIHHHLSETVTASWSDEKLKKLDELWENYYAKMEKIEKVRKLHLNHLIATLQVVAFSNASVSVVHRFVDVELTKMSSRKYFDTLFSDWKLPLVDAVQSFEYRASVRSSHIQRFMELDRESLEQRRYREVTRELIAFFTSDSDWDEITLSDMEENLHTALFRSRNGYYQNIFALDSKAQAITQTLKETIVGLKNTQGFAQKNKRFKSKLQELRLQDEQKLQQVFQNIISNLQKAFKRFNCETIEKFIKNYRTFSCQAKLAIEYWQLQVMEMLCSSGYFGDTFSTLTRSVPAIWGKTYRNYLAHDGLSYDLLTYSVSTQMLINGFVLAWESDGLNIFTKAPKYSLDGLVAIEREGFLWLGIQQELLSDVWKFDQLAAERNALHKPELKGLYLQAPGFLLRLKYYNITEILSHRHHGKLITCSKFHLKAVVKRVGLEKQRSKVRLPVRSNIAFWWTFRSISRQRNRIILPATQNIIDCFGKWQRKSSFKNRKINSKKINAHGKESKVCKVETRRRKGIKSSKIDYSVLLNLKKCDNLPIKRAIQHFKRIQLYLSAPCVGVLLPLLVRNNDFLLLQQITETYAGGNVGAILLMTMGRSEREMNFLETHTGHRISLIGEFVEEALRELFTEESPASTYELSLIILRNDVLRFSQIIREFYKTSKLTLEKLDIVEMLEVCCLHGRLEMAKILIKLLDFENKHLLLEESVRAAVWNQHWKIVELLLDSGVDPWFDSGVIFLKIVKDENFKLARRMLSMPIPESVHQAVLLWTAELGSKQLLDLIIGKGINIWQYDGILNAAKVNKRVGVHEMVQQRIFEFNCCSLTDEELALWYKVINEFKILIFLSLSNWIQLIASDSFALEQILEKISAFLQTDDNHFAASFHFEESFRVTCTYLRLIQAKLPDDQLLMSRDHSLLTIDKCSNLIRDIQNLPDKLIVKNKTFFTIFQHPNGNLEAQVDLTLHCTDFDSNIIDNVLTIPLEDHRHTADAISFGMRRYLLKFRSLKAATAIIKINEKDVQYYRYLQIDSSSCIVQEAFLPDFDLKFLLTPSKSEDSIIYFLKPDIPRYLFETLLRLGADPIVSDSQRRILFRFLLVKKFSLELIQLVYQHCQENNSAYLPDGTHIFNLPDDKGYTPLQLAIATNNYEAAKFLLQNGADPTVADPTGEAAMLDYAILNRNVQMVQLLLEHNPNLVTLLAKGTTVLETALKINHEYLVMLVLEHGANINHRNSEGCIPLKYAIENEAIESLKILLDFAFFNGVDVDDDVDGYGTTAIEFAREEEVDFGVIRELVIYKIKLGALYLSQSLEPQTT